MFRDDTKLHPSEAHILSILSKSEKPLTVRQTSSRSGFSEIYTRNLMKTLEVKSFIKRTDARQPYEYVAVENDPKSVERVEVIRRQLLADEDTPNAALVNMIRKIPRDEWNKAARDILVDHVKALDLIAQQEQAELERIETL